MKKYSSFTISFLCMLVTFVLVERVDTKFNLEVVEKSIHKIPYNISGYVGTDIVMDDPILKELNTDAYLYRRYIKEGQEEITLYIGYYGTKKGGRTGHNPGACYPGSGWAILDNANIQLGVAVGGKRLDVVVNSMVIKKAGVRALVYHWYQNAEADVVASGFWQNINRLRRRILLGRDDGGFISVSQEISGNLEHTTHEVENFSKKVFTLAAKHWPFERAVGH